MALIDWHGRTICGRCGDHKGSGVRRDNGARFVAHWTQASDAAKGKPRHGDRPGEG